MTDNSAVHRGPLADVRVLDFSKFLPGPYCSWMLADLGATVVRIEHPRELAKQAQVFGWNALSDDERAHLRARDIFARNKRSVLLDPGAASSREALLELVSRADILLEDYRPGVLEGMGLGFAPLSQLNPKLIYCSVTLCGQTGPYRDKPGHDPIALALSGALSRMGDRPDRPAFPGVPVADLMTGSNAVIGILAALHARDRTGRGQQIDIAMSDTAMALIASTVSRNDNLSRLPPRGAGRVDCGLWRTSDGRWLCTTDMEPRYWERFCRVMGREDFIPLQLDAGRRDEVIAALAAIFASRPLAEWLDVLGNAGTQFAPVQEIEEALADPHNRQRHMVFELDGAHGTRIRQIASPIKLSDTPTVAPVPAAWPDDDIGAALQLFGCDSQRAQELRERTRGNA